MKLVIKGHSTKHFLYQQRIFFNLNSDSFDYLVLYVDLLIIYHEYDESLFKEITKRCFVKSDIFYDN